jgi:hypothetical protein
MKSRGGVLFAKCHEAQRIDQRLGRERLGQKTGGPGGQRFLGGVALRGARDDGDAVAARHLHDAAQTVQPVHPRHSEVQQDQVINLARGQAGHDRSQVLDAFGVHARFVVDVKKQGVAQQFVVIGNQDTHYRTVRFVHGATKRPGMSLKGHSIHLRPGCRANAGTRGDPLLNQLGPTLNRALYLMVY